ncbi:hypothetical protein H1R20_g1467, partial [Candolleomyces eurysporus]
MVEKHTREVRDLAIVPVRRGGGETKKDSVDGQQKEKGDSEAAEKEKDDCEAAEKEKDDSEAAETEKETGLRDTLAVRLCISGWLNDKKDVTAPWTVFEGDDTYALQWEIEALEELSNALTALIHEEAFKYVKGEILKRTFLAALMASMAPLALLKIGQIIVHALTLLNGNVFGISGFCHRAVKGNVEGVAGAAGLVLGGSLIALIDGKAPAALSLPLAQVAASGFLVGLGTKLSNGCTSGSLVATASFFTTGVITAHLFHGDSPAIGSFDWTLGPSGAEYLAYQLLPLAASFVLYIVAQRTKVRSGAVNKNNSSSKSIGLSEESALLSSASSDTTNATNYYEPQSSLRTLAFFTTSVQFALALQLSSLTEPIRVISFLLLPLHKAFDPSLAFLAAGALPLAIALYRYGRGNEVPVLGGKWGIPKGGPIDLRLLAGAAIFGVGWGMAGVCPGPGLINLGRALAGGANASQFAVWLAALVGGGLLA